MSREISEEPLSIPTLGRRFYLGMAYDCRSDKAIPAVTLWDPDRLKEIDGERFYSSNHKVLFSDAHKEKSSFLNITGGLKLSCLVGLLEGSGYAKYLTNYKSSSDVERVTLAYKCIIKTERMTMNHLGEKNIQYPNALDQDTATHVVTEITYGGSAFFVFEKCKSSDSTHSEFRGNLRGNLSVVVNKFAELIFGDELGHKKTENCEPETAENSNEEKTEQSNSVKGAVHGKNDIKENMTNIKVTCFGDFVFDENATSVEDAIQLYKRLPVELKKNPVPVSASLYPLSKLTSKASKLTRLGVSARNVSDILATNTENCLENFHNFHMKCNELLQSDASKRFHVIRSEISLFIEYLKLYKQYFIEAMREIVLPIRSAEKDESELTGILKENESSPFGYGLLSRWIQTKERHMKIIQGYIKFLTKTKLASEPDLEAVSSNPVYHDMQFASELDDLEVASMNPEYHDGVICFTILVPSGKMLLKKMSEYLKNRNILLSEDISGENTELQLNATANETTMAEKASHFIDFFKRYKENRGEGLCFIVAGESVDSNEFQAKIRRYKNGRITEDDCEIPSAPRCVRVDSDAISHDSITVQWEEFPPGPFNITRYKVVCKDTRENYPTFNQYSEPNANNHTVLGLESNREYRIMVYNVSQFGISQNPEVDQVVKTKRPNIDLSSIFTSSTPVA